MLIGNTFLWTTKAYCSIIVQVGAIGCNSGQSGKRIPKYVPCLDNLWPSYPPSFVPHSMSF